MTFDRFLIDEYVISDAKKDDACGFYVHYVPRKLRDAEAVKVEEGDEDE